MVGGMAEGTTSVALGILKNSRTTEWRSRIQEMVQEFNMSGDSMGTSPIQNDHFSGVGF